MSLTGLDHVVLAVPELEPAGRQLEEALGLVVEPGGERAIARLGASYLELVTVTDALLAGWVGYALRTDARVATADAGSGGILPVLIHDASQPLQGGADHPIGAVGIKALGVAVQDLAASIPVYQALFGAAPRRDHFAFVRSERASWKLPDGSIVRLMAPERPGAGPVAEHLETRGQGLMVVGLAVRSLEPAIAELGRRGTRVSAVQEGRVVFVEQPARTLGARFALIEQRRAS